MKPHSPEEEEKTRVLPDVLTIDEALEKVRGKGKYNMWVAIATSITVITSMMYVFSLPLFLAFPEVNGSVSGTTETIRMSLEQACEQRTYHYVNRWFNFLSEYDLLCDEVAASLIPSSYFLGNLIGCFVFNPLSDSLGRVKVLLIGQTGTIVCLMTLLFWSNYTSCLVFSTLIGFFGMASGPSAYTLMSDSIRPRDNVLYTTLLNLAFALGEIFVAVILWTQMNWRLMCCCIAAFAALFYPTLYIVKESPRFALNKGCVLETKAKLIHIARVNDSPLPFQLEIKASSETRDSLNKSLKEMLLQREILVRLGCCFAIFFSASTVYSGLAMSIQKQEGNVYVNMIWNALAEMVAICSGAVWVKKLGKKAALVASFAIAGVFFVFQGLPYNLSMYLGKFGVSAAFSIAYIVAADIFPSAIKGSALGIGMFGARLGGLVSPFLAIKSTLLATSAVSLSFGAIVVTCMSPMYPPPMNPTTTSPSNLHTP